MQSQPKNTSQIFMTAIGLVLLAMALILNHRHPHNEGIAALPHNSIYNLALNVTQQADRGTSFAFARAVGTPKPASQASNDAQPAQVIVVAASIVSAPTDQCTDLDQQNYKDALKAYDDSYATYLSAKGQVNNSSSDAPGKDTKADADYQAYLDSLQNTYYAYLSALAASGCTPSKAAPAPADR
jgi:hypothetical protein